MTRIITCFLLYLSLLGLPIASLAAAPIINLSDLKNINLTPHFEYFNDKKELYTFNDLTDNSSKRIAAIDKQWQPLKRNQLRYGFMQGTLWLKTEIITQDDKESLAFYDTYLELYKLIDNIRIRLEDKHGNIQYIGIHETRQDISFTNVNSNIFKIRLKPNNQYKLIIKINSRNAVNDSINLWQEKDYLTYNNAILYGFIFYLACILVVSCYNIATYITTRYKAFLHHAMYGIAILCFQAAIYGYINRLFNTGSPYLKEALVEISIGIAYVAVINFLLSIVSKRPANQWFIKSATTINYVMIALLPLLLIVPYQTLMMAEVIIVALGSLNVALFFIYSIYHKNYKDAYVLSAAFTLLVPSTLLLILCRMGIIETNFFYEHILMFSILIEMIVMSTLLFQQIKSLNNDYLKAHYFDKNHSLPNEIAIKEKAKQLNSYTYVSIWLSGLDKMEISFGVQYCNDFLTSLSKDLEQEMASLSFLINHSFVNNHDTILFLPEKNTLPQLATYIDNDRLEVLANIVKRCLLNLKRKQRYNIDILPILAGAHGCDSDHCINQVQQRTRIALAHGFKNNKPYLIYNDYIGDIEKKQLLLINDFPEALKRNEFFLLWQPQVDANTKNLAGVEALVRWNHPTLGFVPPDEFIPLLENSMQISELSHWVIKHAFTEAKKLIDFSPELDISLNLSAHDLLNAELIPFLDKQIALHPNMANKITLEVTESVMIQDNDAVLKAVEAIQKRGFKFSIDDFGAGYASFGYLQTLPANELKIDQRFAKAFTESNSQAIIASIISMAKKLQMNIVIEGIEHQQQVDMFTHWGAERLQGWKLGKPMLLEELTSRFPLAPAKQV